MATLYEIILQTLMALREAQMGFLRSQGAPPNFIGFLDKTLTPLTGFLAMLLTAVTMLTVLALNVIMIIWVERKLIARMHNRRGPSHVGYAGLLQNIADALKLLHKENITPSKVDRLGFNLTPIILAAASMVAVAAIPISPSFLAANLNASVLFVLAVLSVTPFAVFLGGWSSNNKYSLIGALRATAQLIAYEIPLVLSIVGVVMLAGSFNLIEIVNAQSKVWYFLLQPLGVALFFIAILAEVERIPFDLPEAEAELVEGWWTEYGGMRFGLFQLAEYFRAFAGAALLTLLFFGGWRGPFLPAELWFFIKLYLIFAVMVWVRAALPRVRIDQLLSVGWRRLLPLAMVNILMAAFFISLEVA